MIAVPNHAAGRCPYAALLCLFVFYFLFGALQNGQAQTQFIPGYYVTDQGDTIRGKIDQLASSRTPRDIQFQVDGKTTTFNAKTARGFGIDKGANYYRHYVTYSTRPVDINLLRSGDFEDKTITDTAFLSKMVSGKWSLYALYAGRFIYFIQHENDPLQELQYQVYLSGDQQYYDEKNIFRNQLNNLMSAQMDAALLQRLERTNYTGTELTSFVKRINRAAGSQSVVAGAGPGRKLFHFYGGVGYSFNRFSIKKSGSKDLLPLEYMNYTYTNSPMLQVGVELRNQEVLGPFIFRAELAYYGIKIKGQGVYNEFNYYKDLYLSLDVDAKFIQPSFQALIKLIRQKEVEVFAGPALAANFSSYKTNKLVTEYENDPSSHSEGPLTLSKTWLQGQLLAGVMLQSHYQFQVKYAFLGSMMGDDVYKKGSMQSLQLQLNYRF